MKSKIEQNKELFVRYKIPFSSIDNDKLKIVTRLTDYIVDLNGLSNNKHIFKITKTIDKSIKLESKEVFLRKMCKYFKQPFEHWDELKKDNQKQYVKLIPKEIKVGMEYTTIWANPGAKWILSEIIDDGDVILVSPKNKKLISAKINDLRILRYTK